MQDGEDETAEDHYNGDAEIADNEIEFDPDDKMQEVESQYPEYQQNIRDALAEFSEVISSGDMADIKYFFTRFLSLETADMELETKIKDTYHTILSILTEYLTDESVKIVSSVEEDKQKFLRSWEAARVAAIKVQSAVGKGMGNQEKKAGSGGLQKLRKKWCGVS